MTVSALPAAAGRWLAGLLPGGRELPGEQWRAHHRFVLRTLAVLGVVVVGYALAEGRGPLGALALGAPVVALGAVACLPLLSRSERASVAAIGLMTAAAVVVQISGGRTEAHFLFFALLPLAALYATPVPFLLSVGFVALHHLVFGTLAPGSVFEHHAAPLPMALLHAVFVLVESWACLVAWHRFEGRRESVERLVLERTAQVRAQHDALARAAAVVQSTDDAVLTISPAGLVETWNPGAERLYGHTAADVVGRHVRLLHPAEHREHVDGALASLQDVPHLRVERRHARRDGSVFDALVTVSAIGDGEGRTTGYAAIVRDVTAQKRSEAEALATARRLREQAGELTRLAHTDPLTGLANRALMQQRLQASLADGARLAVLLLDLDDFKRVNDVFGHGAGDAVLVEVARRLRGCLRPADTVARLGGDEFVVLVHDVTGPADAHAVASRLLESLAPPVAWQGERFDVGCSIGMTVTVPGDPRDPGALLRDADIAMYAAKSDGRERARLFEPGMYDAVVAQDQLVRELRAAVPAGELRLHHQPQVDLLTGAVRGVEALVRWQHPVRGLLYPDAFVPAAENAGIVDLVDDWALAEACRQLRAWDDAGLPPLRIGVNLSARRLARGGLAGSVLAATAAAGVDPARLELEVTETGALAPGTDAAGELGAVRALGAAVAIDDFGMGHSSFSRLQALPLDRLKIDRSFVAGLRPETAAGSIAGAMVALGRGLGLEVVAEGVEDDVQLAALRSLGCPVAQGYLFARPLPADGLAALVRAGAPVAV